MTEREGTALERPDARHVDGGRSGADPLSFARQLLRLLDGMSMGLAYVGGAVLLLISFFITADVIARKFLGFSSALTDEFGGYALAIGGLWALAFCLTTGAQVRIDILLPYFPPRVREVLNYTALVLLVAFGAIVAWYSWKLTLESFTTDARAMSFIRTPLFVPQACMAIGFTLVAAQGIVMLFVGLTESLRRRTMTPLPVLQVDNLTEGL